MPNTTAHAVRKPRDVDPRVARTTYALGHALIELIQQRRFGEITVQDILDRAGVGRTTFYAHYRNKEDVLQCSYERLFQWLEAQSERPAVMRERVFPVAELLAHLNQARPLVKALGASGQLPQVWSLCGEYAARIIERRLGVLGVPAGEMPPALYARMLAGALVEMVRWWLDRAGTIAPAQMDRAFHAGMRLP